MSSNLKNQSNPFSTGGGGINFETRVQAAFALSLLTSSCIPCLSKNMKATELRFQSKYTGIHTDDFVLVASDEAHNQCKLYAQIKHSITIGSSIADGAVFAEVINSAWKDFKSDDFNTKNDAIVLVTGLLSKTDINNTLPILEWAKYSSSSDDFIKKSQTKGFTSKEKINKLDTFKTQLTHANQGIPINNDELWLFLKVFHIISFDLDAKSSIVANLLCSLIQYYSDVEPSLVLAKLVTCVQEFNQNAGILTRDNVPTDVSTLFDSPPTPNFRQDILKLQEHSDYIYDGILNTIGGFHINRSDELEKISKIYPETNFLFVTGPRGSGKSGLVKDFIAAKRKDAPIFYLRAEDLDKSHLDEVFTSIGVKATLKQIEGYFALFKEKILVIESLEKVLELNNQAAFADLLQFINKQTGWFIIATGRDYAYQPIIFQYLESIGIKYDSVCIGELTQEQVNLICTNIPELNGLVSNSSLADILKIPFFIDIAVRSIRSGAQFKSGDTENDFRNIIWSSIISKESDRRSGLPIKRRTTFIAIAKQRAKKMVYAINADEFESEVLLKLEEDDLIRQDPNTSTISLTHDILEDWALEEFINSEYIKNTQDLNAFLSAIGVEPAITRAFRLWLYRQLKFNDSTQELVENILTTDNIESYWKDETITAIMQYDSPQSFLDSLKSQLLKNNGALLIRFCFILRIACQVPSNLFNQYDKNGVLKSLFLKPYGNGWEAFLNFIYDVRQDLNQSIYIHIIELINEWCKLINIHDDLPNASKKVGLLALWLLEPIKDSYNNKQQKKKILDALLKVSPSIETDFDELMEQDVFISKVKSKRLGYVDDLANLALLSTTTALLCKYRPKFIIKLALHEFLLSEEAEENDHWSNYYHTHSNEYIYGLDSNINFFPASGLKGPFSYLLQFHNKIALDFIVKLCNTASKKCAESPESKIYTEHVEEQDIVFSNELVIKLCVLQLNDQTTIEQFVSPQLWKGYRDLSTLPDMLKCALMALENWLINYINKCNENNKIEDIYDYLLKNSNSVMVTSVLASVATGFPEKIGKAAFPLLKTTELYSLDFHRAIREMGENTSNFFNSRDTMSELYRKERKESILRPWRKKSLEDLLLQFQFYPEFKTEAIQIVDELIKEAETRDEKYFQYMLHRVDSRKLAILGITENNQVVLQLKSELPEDLKKHQQEIENRFANHSQISKLFLWSSSLLEGKTPNKEYFATYQDALETAKELYTCMQNQENTESMIMHLGAITKTAAVCIRDEMHNLNDENQAWCINILYEAIFIDEGIDDKADIFGSSSCAFVLPKLFELNLDTNQKENLQYGIAKALTHENISISTNAAKGVREFLWSKEPELALCYLNGMVEYTKFYLETTILRRKALVLAEGEAIKDWSDSINTFYNKLVNGEFKVSIDNISLTTHSTQYIHIPMLMIPLGTNNTEQTELLKKIVNLVFESENESYRSNDIQKIHHEIETEIEKCLAEHIVHSKHDSFRPFKELLITGCYRAPDFIDGVLINCHTTMQQEDDFISIWLLWSLLSPTLHKIALNDDELNNNLCKFLRRRLFINTPWNGHPSDKRLMEEGVNYLLEFAKKSANNSHVFEALSSLIYNFYDIFFEKGIPILAEKLSNNSLLITKRVNTGYYLEISITRYLQVEHKGALKRNMYESCLNLLNGIIEKGSSRAYYLREHLVRSRKVSI